MASYLTPIYAINYRGKWFGAGERVTIEFAEDVQELAQHGTITEDDIKVEAKAEDVQELAPRKSKKK